MNKSINQFCLILWIAIPVIGIGQNTTVVSTSKDSTVVIAGEQYKRGGLHTFFWGRHYRKEWSTPVTVKNFKLDTTAFGGLKPTETGGGRQTKNLRLQAPNGRQYAIRSIDKDYGKALPEEAQGTFIESIVKDQMSVAHPYAGSTITPLAEAAKVYTTDPQIVFVGDDAALGEFKEEFANNLYSFEDRPTGKNAKFYKAEDVLDTEVFLEKMLESNKNRVDQKAYARARLFDMLIGDWDRHEEQWKWAAFKENGITVYRPLPKDRDQVYAKFDGLLLKPLAGMAKLPYLQGFYDDIKDVEGFNLEARSLDIQFTNELTVDDWKAIATGMQSSVTDAVIESAIKLLPPEVYSISGEEIINKLKSRRDHLPDFAERYYSSLAKAVDIPATKDNELILVTGLDAAKIKVTLLDLNKDGSFSSSPFYTRTFLPSETKEIRIYGIDGNDKFTATETAGRDITIRLIGGPAKDSYEIPNSFSGKVRVYDNNDNAFTADGAKLYLSSDTSVHKFDRKIFKPDDVGIKPKIGYNNDDKLFIGLGYRIRRQGWRVTPYRSSNEIWIKYSILQKASSIGYDGIFNKAIGDWNIGLSAVYDAVRDAHFLGIGNNTVKVLEDRNFYRYRNKEVNASLSLFKTFNKYHTVTFFGFYQMVRLLEDNDRFIALYTTVAHPTSAVASDNFAGGKIEYDFTHVNNKLYPNKGIRFNTAAEFTQNLQNTNSIKRLTGLFGFYVPVGPLTLAVKTGAATLWGEPEFYQLNKLGGGPTLRGYSRFRFYGKTSFFNQNELQWNFNVKTYLFSGKIGLIALFDNGRVWIPGETSTLWHTAIGGGLMLAPFNKVAVTILYGVSKEDSRISVRFGHFLRR
jgi:hypothetical protein